MSGLLPGYTIRYVSQVIADPSGRTIHLPGRYFLLVRLQPAQAHNAAGAPTIDSAVHTLGFPVLQGWALAGDFEGVTRIALGLSHRASIRVGELPGRLFIDIKE